jgi:hypothetical protein
MFRLAEGALHTYPGLEKVTILKRPPRFDPVIKDPLEIKPQLSRFGNAILFDLWCNSEFKSKIVIGDHQIPHLLDDTHCKVFGNPDLGYYDGLHMYGAEGRKAFQSSILNILKQAGLVTGKKEPNIPNGWNVERNKNSNSKSKISNGQQSEYDPMRMFRERHGKGDQSQNGFQKDGMQNNRTSVIKTTNMQDAYCIPISNSFDTLGNLDRNLGN